MLERVCRRESKCASSDPPDHSKCADPSSRAKRDQLRNVIKASRAPSAIYECAARGDNNNNNNGTNMLLIISSCMRSSIALFSPPALKAAVIQVRIESGSTTRIRANKQSSTCSSREMFSIRFGQVERERESVLMDIYAHFQLLDPAYAV